MHDRTNRQTIIPPKDGWKASTLYLVDAADRKEKAMWNSGPTSHLLISEWFRLMRMLIILRLAARQITAPMASESLDELNDMENCRHG